jgi:hypothetical protein
VLGICEDVTVDIVDENVVDGVVHDTANSDAVIKKVPNHIVFLFINSPQFLYIKLTYRRIADKKVEFSIIPAFI